LLPTPTTRPSRLERAVKAIGTRKRKQASAIQFSDGLPTLSGVCHSCAFPRSPRGKAVPSPGGSRVRIVDITRVRTGWIARGQVRRGRCSHCGAAYVTLVRYIPIECASFPCPTCGPGSELTTDVLSITESETGYDFVAQLKCNACSKPHLLSRVLGGLSKITKVKVGPTGVEVEVTPQAPSSLADGSGQGG
jgi:hypothetical protein